MPLQIRRGTEAERISMIHALAPGEIIYVTDTQRIYVGNGTTVGGVQVTGYTDGDAQDAAANIFDGVSHTGISFTYDDVSNKMTAAIDLSNYPGSITADSVKGSVFADDSTVIVDAIDQKIFAVGGFFGPLQGAVTGNVTGNLTGNVTGNVTGNTTGTHTGVVRGDVTGSVFADDSTILVDGVSGRIVGPVFADVTGNVTGTVTGILNGTANGTFNGTVNGDVVVISGYSGGGQRAGIRIETDGDLNDGYDLFTINGASNNADGQAITFHRSRGTLSSPTASQVGDTILSMAWLGTDSKNAAATMAALIVSADDTPSAGYVPGRMSFSIFDSGGTPQNALSFGPDLVVTVADNALTAGGSSGQVNTGAVAHYLKINVGGTDYAMPLYAIRP